MINAKRGPSYLRFGGSARSGRVEMPEMPEVHEVHEVQKTAEPVVLRPSTADDALQRQLQRWEAPVLSDEEIEVYAKIFLMRPGHELIPFFMWMDAARIRTEWRRGPSEVIS